MAVDEKSEPISIYNYRTQKHTEESKQLPVKHWFFISSSMQTTSVLRFLK
jgi:hypothetical protein